MPGEDTPNDTPTALEHNSPRSGSTQVSPRILTAPWRQRELILVTAAGLGALLVMSPIGNTAAEITDTATAKTGQFATVQTFTCEDYSPGLFASSARITWTAPGPGTYTYRVLVLKPDGTTYSDNTQSSTSVDITLPPRTSRSERHIYSTDLLHCKRTDGPYVDGLHSDQRPSPRWNILWLEDFRNQRRQQNGCQCTHAHIDSVDRNHYSGNNNTDGNHRHRYHRTESIHVHVDHNDTDDNHADDYCEHNTGNHDHYRNHSDNNNPAPD